MAEWVQLGPATATTGDLMAADFVALGSATSVALERIKTGFGTDGSWTETATNAPFPVVVETFRATGTVNVAAATGSISVIQPTATELNVTVASAATFAVVLP